MSRREIRDRELRQAEQERRVRDAVVDLQQWSQKVIENAQKVAHRMTQEGERHAHG